MPFSSGNGKDHIRRIINRLKPKTGLDIGCGSGTYADMFPNIEWTGVEIWEPYVEKYDLRRKYKMLYVEDARTLTLTAPYDVVVLGDVLEHMTVEEARTLFDKMYGNGFADTVIVSIPLGHYPQGEFDGNPYEAHVKDDWTDAEVRATFGEPTWSAIEGEIGVYVWSKHKVGLNICVYAIAKNEAHFVPRFCESAKDADLILIADTGSTDGLPEVARYHGATVYDIHISPWRFDMARNAALALVPKDVDVCISLDIDEVLQPGWREEIERVWTPGTTRLRYLFDWGAGIQFYYEKIHARHGYRWHHPCHEYPVPDGRITEVWAQSDKLLAVHMPDPTKSRGQYLDLLKLSVEEDPDCPRNAFYYGRELSFHGKWREAIDACERYLKLPRATWPNERAYAYRVMGRSYEALQDPWNAELAFQRACSEAPGTREPWCDLAMLYYRMERWPECFAMSMRALAITNREAVYTCDPAVWGHWAHDLASISAYHMGMLNVAVEQAEMALAKTPDDPRLKANLEACKRQIVS